MQAVLLWIGAFGFFGFYTKSGWSFHLEPCWSSLLPSWHEGKLVPIQTSSLDHGTLELRGHGLDGAEGLLLTARAAKGRKNRSGRHGFLGHTHLV